jgi:low temperature requirement protein LtrA
MLTGSRKNILRVRKPHEHARVTYVELFFDLVFVFAVTQLSHTMLEHFTPLGMAEVLLLYLAVWWAWMYTSWATNWLDPQYASVRLLLFGLMIAGLLLSTSIPKAFETRGLAFVSAYVAIQIGRSIFMLWAFRHHNRPNFKNFQRIFCWFSLSTVFWIAGGFADAPTRLALWAVAIAIEYLGPSSYFWVPGLGRSNTGEWDVEGGHMAERCGLFVIIALGESVLITGATFGNLDWNAVTVGLIEKDASVAA